MPQLSNKTRNNLIRILTLWKESSNPSTSKAKQLPEELKTSRFIQLMRTAEPSFNYEILKASLSDPAVSKLLDTESVNKERVRLRSDDASVEEPDATDLPEPSPDEEMPEADVAPPAAPGATPPAPATPAVPPSPMPPQGPAPRDVVASMADRARKRIKT